MNTQNLTTGFFVAVLGALWIDGFPCWGDSEIDEVLSSLSSTGIPPESHQDFWQQVTDAISKELRKNFSQEMQLHFPIPRIHMPRETRFTIASVQFDPRMKKFSALITLEDGRKKMPISGNVSFFKRVPVLKQSLNTGEILLPHHLDWVSIEDDYRVNDVILDPQELSGAILKKPLHVGDMPQSRYLKTSMRIDRGDPVEITYKIKNLSIRNSGARALASGKKGDLIPVTNPTRSKERLPPLWVVVEARGHVSIQAS